MNNENTLLDTLNTMRETLIGYIESCEEMGDKETAWALGVALSGVSNGIDALVYGTDDNEPWDGFNTDAEADADALASAGHGTDGD